jgi:hypothetical protein
VESEPAYEIYLFDSLFKSTCVRFVTLFKKKRRRKKKTGFKTNPQKHLLKSIDLNLYSIHKVKLRVHSMCVFSRFRGDFSAK